MSRNNRTDNKQTAKKSRFVHLVVAVLPYLARGEVRHQKYVVRLVRASNVPAPAVVGDLFRDKMRDNGKVS